MLYNIVIEDYELRLYLRFFAIIINIIDLTTKPPPPPVLLLFKELFFFFFFTLFLALTNYRPWLYKLPSGYMSF